MFFYSRTYRNPCRAVRSLQRRHSCTIGARTPGESVIVALLIVELALGACTKSRAVRGGESAGDIRRTEGAAGGDAAVGAENDFRDASTLSMQDGADQKTATGGASSPGNVGTVEDGGASSNKDAGADNAPTDGCTWQVVFPRLGHKTLRALWGSGSQDVYAVGDQGTILHYDGQQWMKVPIDTKSDFLDIWGSASNDIYAVGGTQMMGIENNNPTAYHFDGSSWNEISLGDNDRTLTAVWGTGPNNVFIAGRGTPIWHFNGLRWSETGLVLSFYEDDPTSQTSNTQDWLDLFGCGSDEVYALSGDRVVWGFDSTTLQFRLVEGLERCPLAIGTCVCTSLDDLWVINVQPYSYSQELTDSNGVIHWNGQRWQGLEAESPETEGQMFTKMFITPDGERFLIGQNGALFFLDGSVWRPIDTGTRAHLHAIWSESSERLYVAGDQGALLEITPDGARPINNSVGAPIVDLLNLGSDGLAAITESGELVIGNEQQWDVVLDAEPADTHIESATGSKADDILMGGYESTEFWIPMMEPYPKTLLLHYDGQELHAIDSDMCFEPTGLKCGAFVDLQMVGDDVFAVCTSGEVLLRESRAVQPDGDPSCEQTWIGLGNELVKDFCSHEAFRLNYFGPWSSCHLWGNHRDSIFILVNYASFPYAAPRIGMGAPTVSSVAIHYNGVDFTEIPIWPPTFSFSSAPTSAVWGSPEDLDVLYVWSNHNSSEKDETMTWDSCVATIKHYDGSAWTIKTGCEEEAELKVEADTDRWGFSGPCENCFFSDWGGAIYYDGAMWQTIPFDIGERGVIYAGNSATDMYAASPTGGIYRRVCK